jgi:hypothetical protein
MKKLTFTKNKIENLPDWLKLLVNLVEKGLKLSTYIFIKPIIQSKKSNAKKCLVHLEIRRPKI